MINRENIKHLKEMKNIQDDVAIQKQIEEIKEKLKYAKSDFERSYLNSEIDRLLLEEVGVEVFVNLIDEKAITDLDESAIKDKQEQLMREIQELW